MTRIIRTTHRRLIAAFAFILLLAASADARSISVALSKNSPSLSVSSSSAVTATDAGGRRHSLGTSPVFRASGKGSVQAGASVLRLPRHIVSKKPPRFQRKTVPWVLPPSSFRRRSHPDERPRA